MGIYLNEKQTEGLANFFLDVAKGLLLAGVGAITISTEKIFIIFIFGFFSFICMMLAMYLLKKV